MTVRRTPVSSQARFHSVLRFFEIPSTFCMLSMEPRTVKWLIFGSFFFRGASSEFQEILMNDMGIFGEKAFTWGVSGFMYRFLISNYNGRSDNLSSKITRIKNRSYSYIFQAGNIGLISSFMKGLGRILLSFFRVQFGERFHVQAFCILGEKASCPCWQSSNKILVSVVV